MRAAPQPTVIVDTGPLLAFLDRGDSNHDWAKARFGELRPPLTTCEAVLSEASFLLTRIGADAGLAIALVERGVLAVGPLLGTGDDAAAIRRLMRRYDNVPMSFADACLVRLVERAANASIMTLDADFHIYRQARRRVIPLIAPQSGQ